MENVTITNKQTKNDQEHIKQPKRSRAFKLIASIAVVGTMAALIGTAASTSFGTSSTAGSQLRVLQSDNEVSIDDLKIFQRFIQKHNKNYLTKEEHSARLKIFSANLALIKGHDAEATGFKIGINQFSDMSLEEFQKMQGFKENPPAQTNKFLDDDDDEEEEAQKNQTCEEEKKGRGLQSYSSSIDWRQQGVLNAIRNQGSCGGCYTFSTACSVEAAYKIKFGTLPRLSEQQLLDCTSRYGNSGCGGGLMTNDFKYLKDNLHMNRDSYPYTAQQGRCKYDEGNGVTKVKSFKSIRSGDVDGHIAVLQNQPISIAVAAGSSIFMQYKGGIINSSSCGTNVDHAVNMVGYGTENGKDFWILRNSWGTSWGEKGYFRVARSDKDGPGVCGILKMSSYPIL